MKIYALEVTSECNLKCSYCPQPNMQRPKEHMPFNLFKQALDYPHWYDVVIGHLFGEAFLHPDIEAMTSLAHNQNLAFGFSTNMRDFNLDDFNKLREKGLSWMVISYHIPEARKWHKYLTENYPDFPIMTSELEQRHDWAGQIDKNKKGNIKKNVFDTKTVAKNDCIFHKYDLVTVSSQGDIYACCLDAEGLSNQGSLFNYTPEEFSQLKNDIWFELCKSCPMTAADEQLQHINDNMQQSAQKVFDYRDFYFNNKD